MWSLCSVPVAASFALAIQPLQRVLESGMRVSAVDGSCLFGIQSLSGEAAECGRNRVGGLSSVLFRMAQSRSFNIDEARLGPTVVTWRIVDGSVVVIRDKIL